MAQINNGIILTGLKNLDGVTIENGEVKISASSLSTDTVTLTATGLYKDFKLTLANDVTGGNEMWLLNGGKFNYKSTAGYSLVDNEISYKAAGSFSITGLQNLAVNSEGKIEGVEIAGNTITISAGLLTSEVTLTTTGDYKLLLEDSSEYTISNDGKTITAKETAASSDDEDTTVTDDQVATNDDVSDFLDDIFNG